MSEEQIDKNYDTENRKMKEITYIDYTTGGFIDLPYNATPYDEKVIGMTSKFKEKNPEPFFLVPCIRFQKNLKDTLQLNHKEIGMLFYLMSYANYRSLHYTEKEEVCYFSHCNNNTYFKGNKDLEKILQVSNNIVKKFKKKLKDNGILHEDERGFYIKKEYLIRGKTYSLEKKNRFYKISNNYVKKLVVELRNNNVKKYYSALGFLFSLLSFINIHEKDSEGNPIRPSFNRLVNQEYLFEKDRYLSIPKEELAKRMNVSKSTLITRTRELNAAMKEAFGEYLIFERKINPVGYENEKVTSWFINPHFSYSNDRTTEEYKKLVESSKIKKNKKENVDERN